MGHLGAVADAAWEDNHPARRDRPVRKDAVAVDAHPPASQGGVDGVPADGVPADEP
jgi:hypothetical protein